VSVLTAWDNKARTTLRYIHYGYWTWADVNRAVEEAQLRFRQTRHTVHVIIDLRESASLPDIALREKSTLSLGHGRDGMLILVGVGSLTWPYYDVVKRIYRNRRSSDQVQFVETLEEARALLQGSSTPLEVKVG
jgi:hypothetical protein